MCRIANHGCACWHTPSLSLDLFALAHVRWAQAQEEGTRCHYTYHSDHFLDAHRLDMGHQCMLHVTLRTHQELYVVVGPTRPQWGKILPHEVGDCQFYARMGDKVEDLSRLRVRRLPPGLVKGAK